MNATALVRSISAGRKGYVFVAIAAIVGVAISVAACISVYRWESRLRDLKLEDLARNRNQTIAGDLNYVDELLQTIGEYIEALDHPVGRSEFLAFTSRVRARHPEMRSTGWSVRVPGGERDAFERKMREQGMPDFEIWENGPDGRRRRAGDRSDYYPILYRDPTNLAAAVVGFDLSSMADRGDAMRRALETGHPSATPAMNLISEDRPIIGLISFSAVADPNAEREAAAPPPAGYVFAVFWLEQVFEKVLATMLPEGLDVYVYAPETNGPNRFVYWQSSKLRATPMPFTDEATLLARPHWTGTVAIAGRELGALYLPTEDLFNQASFWEAPATLIAGFAITAIVVAYLLSTLNRAASLENLAMRLQQSAEELRRNNEKVEQLAHHDVLTGLANRVQLRKRMEQFKVQLQTHGKPFAVLILDLDRFKQVNDSLGHAAGDQLLNAVARRLSAEIRREDVLARLGGDEFAIIQSAPREQVEHATVHAEHDRGVITLATRILDILSAPFDIDGSTVFIGSSIGIALAPHDGCEPEDLMKKADLALYEAKSGGRNRYFLFSPDLTKIADERHQLEADMRVGIIRGEFELHYQPVVDVRTRKMSCVEALVRWRHPTRGLIPPDQFIPLAEETGLISPLGDWVLNQACRDAATWPKHIKVAVNLSAAQFRKSDFLDSVLVSLVAADLPAERLEVEVTETVLLAQDTDCVALLHRLRNAGVSVALDDFGTGYSSLSYLKRFPFDKIKIDKSFTHDITERADCMAIVSSTISLGRSLDIITTVEGVETERQFEIIRAAGATLAQGYLFGRAVPAAQLDFGEAPATTTAEAAA